MSFNPNSHIITISGGKGGVGKSVFAANFAQTLLLETRKKVLLIDLDKNSAGDQNIITGIRPNKTVAEITSFTGTINAQTVDSLISKNSVGLYYLAAVKSPDESLNVNADTFTRQLQQFSNLFDFIIVDVGCEYDDLQIEVIHNSSACLFITTPEILALTQSKKQIGQLVAQTVSMDIFQIVVNKASNTGINPQSIAQALQRPIIAMIPQDDVTTAGALQKSALFAQAQANSPIVNAYRDTVRKLIGSNILQKLKTMAKPVRASSSSLTMITSSSDDPKTMMKMRIHSALIMAMDLKKGITDTNGDPAKESALRSKTLQSITQIVDKEYNGLDRNERSSVIKEVLDEALGLGPLEDLLSDDEVSEIMVNGPKRIFVERSGKLTLSSITFTSDLQLRNVIERIVTPLGRRIDEKNPYVDARLKDGSRVNAVIPPVAIDGASITIRKFKKEIVTADHYIKWNSMNKQMISFIKLCVENGLNIIISGGTGSGKTTLLNTMSSFIPANERIITVEDAAELQLNQQHVVRLETKPANMEGTGAVTIRDLVRNTLRMRPDRIVVGECRGGEALDMLSAMNTGHDGSMTTVHSNNPREAIGRLETLVMMAGMDLPSRAIREQIASAVNLIVQVSRLSDGSRKIMSITEVVGMQGEVVTLQEIFKFKETGFDKNRKIIGQFQATGFIPTFIEKFERKGIKVGTELFKNTNEETPIVKKAAGGNG
jgi:pilus assembly protein CpaF